MNTLQLYLLGGFQAKLGDLAINSFRSDKARALLAYLALESDRSHRRETLAALFWPGNEESSARASLRMALSNLRQICASISTKETPLLQASRHTVRLYPDHPCFWIDALQFDAWLDECAAHPHEAINQCLACIRRLMQAAELYQGDFLAGLLLPDSHEFDEWRVIQQEIRHRRALVALRSLGRHYLDRGDYDRAQAYARQQLALEPWQEGAHRQLMHALALAGQRAAALAQYETCRRTLANELGAEPTAETVALYEAIKEGDLPAQAPASMEVAPRPPHNLPQQTTPFIGREKELDDLLRRLLDPDYRLLTLAGVGGIGKTRLALTAAERALPHFDDGVWFTSLAGAADTPTGEQPASPANQLATAIAAALDLTFHGAAEPRQQLLNQLRRKKLLLALDNLESLLTEERLPETADFILDLLRQAPGIVLLVTSRRRLGMQAEYVLTLEGLSVPAIDGQPQMIAESPGVRLFVERAGRILGDFAPTRDDLAAISEICRLADGLPLAIELAATWTPHYAPAEIAQAMQRNLDFLTTPLRDLPRRHRSIGAVFAASWQFLNEKEQTALAQLSIFRGGFSRDAAMTVTEASLRELSSLVDKSLLRRAAAGRYELHALLRQFAAEKWRELSDEQPAARQRLRQSHSDYYLTFIQARAKAINSSQSRQILAEVRQELDNVRLAWQWAVAHNWYDVLAKGIEGLQRFYDFTGLFQEGEAAFRTAAAHIERQPDAPPRLLGRLLAERAYLLSKQGQFDAAIAAAKKALPLTRQAQDIETEIAGRTRLGYAHWRRGHKEECVAQLEKALALAQTAGLPHLEALVLSRFSLVALSSRDYAQAEAYFQRYLAASQEYGDREGESVTYNNLGYIYHAQYDYGRAREYFARALAIKQEMGARQGEGNAGINLGVICLTVGDYEGAGAYYERALQIAGDIGDQRLEGLALSNLSLLRVHQEKFEEAAATARQAIELMRQVGDKLTLGYPLTHLGYALTGLGDWAGAEPAFREAIALRQELGQRPALWESLAGLAQMYLAQGQIEPALENVAPLLEPLQEELPAGVLEPGRLYLTVVKVLQAAADSRAGEFLAVAQERLHTLANRFTEESLKQAYLERSVVHRELAGLRR